MMEPRKHEWWPFDLLRQAALPFLVAMLMLGLLTVWFVHGN